MTWDKFDSQKVCEFCQEQFSTKDSRNRYCPECVSHMEDIRRVINDKSPSLATQEEKMRIYQRVKVGGTTRRGPFKYR